MQYLKSDNILLISKLLELYKNKGRLKTCGLGRVANDELDDWQIYLF